MMDPRLTPARSDLAASSLKGQVAAERFAEGTEHGIARGRIALREKPNRESRQETELLFGESFIAYDVAEGWAWGQVKSDNYVGYVHTIALSDNCPAADHRVSALMTPLLPAPDFKAAHTDMLPMNAMVKVLSRANGFAQIAESGFVCERHLVSFGEYASDFIAVAERFLGVPYVWGGKTAAGIDCSGLVQTALAAAGISAPRDTDMQEKALGHIVAQDGIRRGDLVFWDGHMGVMLDGARLLHANSFHMEVTIEPLADVVRRIERPITSIKRL